MTYGLIPHTIAERVSTAGERRISIIRVPSVSRTSFIDNLVELAHYRDLLYTLTLHRIKVRYKQSLLGVSWAIIQPLSMMLMFTVVFSLIARMPSDGAPYAIFIYTALLPWNCFAASVTSATGGLVSHSQLVTKVYFPREVLPATYVLAALFDFLVGSSVLAALMIYYRVPLTVNALYILPIVLLLVLFSTAVALLFSAAQVHFRDVGMAVPLVLQLWMFATPILYPASAVPASLRLLNLLNPMAGITENFRGIVLNGSSPELRSLAASAVTSVALFVISYAVFKRVEATMADVI